MELLNPSCNVLGASWQKPVEAAVGHTRSGPGGRVPLNGLLGAVSSFEKDMQAPRRIPCLSNRAPPTERRTAAAAALSAIPWVPSDTEEEFFCSPPPAQLRLQKVLSEQDDLEAEPRSYKVFDLKAGLPTSVGFGGCFWP